nr:hypothetical protein Iba_chr02eCG2480 [Ipomoea batatas]
MPQRRSKEGAVWTHLKRSGFAFYDLHSHSISIFSSYAEVKSKNVARWPEKYVESAKRVCIQAKISSESMDEFKMLPLTSNMFYGLSRTLWLKLVLAFRPYSSSSDESFQNVYHQSLPVGTGKPCEQGSKTTAANPHETKLHQGFIANHISYSSLMELSLLIFYGQLNLSPWRLERRCERWQSSASLRPSSRKEPPRRKRNHSQKLRRGGRQDGRSCHNRALGRFMDHLQTASAGAATHVIKIFGEHGPTAKWTGDGDKAGSHKAFGHEVVGKCEGDFHHLTKDIQRPVQNSRSSSRL